MLKTSIAHFEAQSDGNQAMAIRPCGMENKTGTRVHNGRPLLLSQLSLLSNFQDCISPIWYDMTISINFVYVYSARFASFVVLL